MAITTTTPASRILEAVEPWYDWGQIGVERMDEIEDDRGGSVGDVRYFQLQWLGLHVGFQFGRTPKREG